MHINDGAAGKGTYEPEKIIAERLAKGVTQYQVKWVGYDSKHNSQHVGANTAPGGLRGHDCLGISSKTLDIHGAWISIGYEGLLLTGLNKIQLPAYTFLLKLNKHQHSTYYCNTTVSGT
jgi:hypothetical protein